MLEPRNEEIKRVFAAALELPEDARAAYVGFALPDDAGDRAEVHRLLRSYKEDYLSTPALEQMLLRQHESFSVDGEHFEGNSVNETTGRRFGEYEIVGELGRGGMGIVYLARRADNMYDDLVAIKVVQAGRDSEELLDRFQIEIRILASLHHPYIVSLKDAGTRDGHVYLVMEYVDGRRLDIVCRELSSDVNALLGLFLKICEAVEHAHRSLVIHRDLKPSNILVTAEGTPKLLDFGVATLLRGDVEDGVTTGGWRITPRYASPEQMRGELNLTTATDVYSLGVVLYELLTGASPYGADTGPMHVINAMLRSEPIRPRVLEPHIAQDLEAICLKCLGKDPEHRYPSVERLRDDLERYLSGRPVSARPDSLLYRAGKFIRRNRIPLATAFAALIVATSLAAMALYQWRRAEHHMRNEMAVTSDTLKVANGLTWGLPGAAEANYILREAVARHQEDLVRDRPGDWVLKRDLLQNYFQLVEVEGDPETPLNMSKTEAAYQSARKGLGLAEEIAHKDQDASSELGLSHALNYLGKIAAELGIAEESESHFSRAIQINRDVRGEDTVATDRQWVYTHSLALLARVRAAQGIRAAAALSADAVDRRDRWLQLHPVAAPQFRRALSITLRTHGDVLMALGRYRESVHSFERAVAIEQQLFDQMTTPDVVTAYHLAAAQEGLGRALIVSGDLRNAGHEIGGALRRYRQIAKENSNSPMAHRYVARGLEALALLHERDGDNEAARVALEEELPLCRAAVQNDPANTSARNELDRCRENLRRLR